MASAKCRNHDPTIADQNVGTRRDGYTWSSDSRARGHLGRISAGAAVARRGAWAGAGVGWSSPSCAKAGTSTLRGFGRSSPALKLAGGRRAHPRPARQLPRGRQRCMWEANSGYEDRVDVWRAENVTKESVATRLIDHGVLKLEAQTTSRHGALWIYHSSPGIRRALSPNGASRPPLVHHP